MKRGSVYTICWPQRAAYNREILSTTLNSKNKRCKRGQQNANGRYLPIYTYIHFTISYLYRWRLSDF